MVLPDLKPGIGRRVLQAVLDCFSRYAWGQLYTR